MASNAKNLAELLNTDTTIAVADVADGSITTAKLADDAVTNAKIGAGAVGTTEIADDAVTSAKSDGSVAIGKNVIINGAMQVAQRGTSSTGVGASSGYFVCDRWQYYSNGTDGRVTITQDSSAPEGFANSLKIATTTADTSVAAGESVMLMQRIEGQNLQHFKKGTSNANPWALSFYVKGNASATYIAELMDNDNSNRHVGKAFNVTTNWTRVEIIFPADTTGTLDDDSNASIDFAIHLHNGSTFTSGTLQETWGTLVQANRGVGGSSILDSTSRTFFITGVKLEPVQVTDFEHEPFEITMFKCQRYFRHLQSENSTYMQFFNGFMYSSTHFIGAYPLSPKMRGQPALGTSGTASNYEVLFVQNSNACTAVPFLDAQSEPDTLDIRANCSSATQGSGATVRASNTTNAFLTLDAEL